MASIANTCGYKFFAWLHHSLDVSCSIPAIMSPIAAVFRSAHLFEVQQQLPAEKCLQVPFVQQGSSPTLFKCVYCVTGEVRRFHQRQSVSHGLACMTDSAISRALYRWLFRTNHKSNEHGEVSSGSQRTLVLRHRHDTISNGTRYEDGDFYCDIFPDGHWSPFTKGARTFCVCVLPVHKQKSIF